MADADRDLTPRGGASGLDRSLDIIALAPLPYLQDGTPTFSGGVSAFYAELLPRLAALGHQVRVLAEAPALSEGRTGLGWGNSGLQVDWFGFEYLSSWSVPTAEFLERTRAGVRRKLDQWVAEQRPDVIAFGREPTARYAVDFCAEHRLASVVICHGVALAALADGIYPQAIAQELIACVRRADGVIAIAEHLARELTQLGVERVTTIRNVIDVLRFRPTPRSTELMRQYRIAPGQAVVGHVSFLGAVKRPLDVVDSAAIVLRSRPEVIYLIGGEGPGRAQMEERAARLGIHSNFRFTGQVAHEQMPDYLNLCDVIVLSSRREGLPLVGLEAQACGRVLLASDNAAAREMVTDEETGVLFAIGDLDSLAEKTLQLLADSGRREAIGQRARAVRADESLDVWAESYAAALRRASSRKA